MSKKVAVLQDLRPCDLWRPAETSQQLALARDEQDHFRHAGQLAARQRAVLSAWPALLWRQGSTAPSLLPRDRGGGEVGCGTGHDVRRGRRGGLRPGGRHLLWVEQRCENRRQVFAFVSDRFGEPVLGAAAFASLGAGRRGHEDVVADCQRLGECLQRNEPVGSEKKIPLRWLPRRLVQTYCREDHRVRMHAGYFAREFVRTFVDDGQQYAEFCNFASTQSVNLFREYIKPCHRADVWRYLHMYRRGGVYLDFKCGLLQPFWSWLLELQNACMQHELGCQGEARTGAQCPPFMVTFRSITNTCFRA